MKNHVKISDIHFPEPCLMRWETMDEHPDGKFCHGCRKIVYDFTLSTEEEINKILQANKSKICCSFFVDQLPQEKQKFSSSYKFKLVGAFGFTLLSTLIFKPQDVKAQNIAPNSQSESINIFPALENKIDSLYPVCRIGDADETIIN